VIIFIQSFELIGVDSNFDISLPVPTKVSDARPEFTNAWIECHNPIAELTVFGLLILLFVSAVIILLK
jgi:hypothetical protein